MVVDRGGNYDSERFAAAKAALRSFVESLQMPADQIAVASFTTSAAMEQTLVSSTQLAFDALERIIPGGTSYIGAGIAAAQAELSSVRRKPSATPIMIVLSDGSDAGAPNPSASITAANAAKAAGIRIISVQYGGSSNSTMQQIASSSSDYYLVSQ